MGLLNLSRVVTSGVNPTPDPINYVVIYSLGNVVSFKSKELHPSTWKMNNKGQFVNQEPIFFDIKTKKTVSIIKHDFYLNKKLMGRGVFETAQVLAPWTEETFFDVGSFTYIPHPYA